MQTEFLVYAYLGVPASIWLGYAVVQFARHYRSRSPLYKRLFGSADQ